MNTKNQIKRGITEKILKLVSVFLFSVIGLVLTGQPSHADGGIFNVDWALAPITSTTNLDGSTSSGKLEINTLVVSSNIVFLAGKYSGNVDNFSVLQFTNFAPGVNAFIASLDMFGTSMGKPYPLAPSENSEVRAAAVGSNGHYYAAGNYKNSLDGLTNVSFLGSQMMSGEGAFITDVTSNWQTTISIAGPEKFINITSLTMDKKNNVFVAGVLNGTATVQNLTMATISNRTNYFVMKVDSNGTVLWTKVMDGVVDASGNYPSIDIDKYNNLILVGSVISSGNSNLLLGMSNPKAQTPVNVPTVVLTIMNSESGNLYQTNNMRLNGASPNVKKVLVSSASIYVLGNYTVSGSVAPYICKYNYDPRTPAVPVVKILDRNLALLFPLEAPEQFLAMTTYDMALNPDGTIVIGGLLKKVIYSNALPGQVNLPQPNMVPFLAVVDQDMKPLNFAMFEDGKSFAKKLILKAHSANGTDAVIMVTDDTKSAIVAKITLP